MAPVEVDRILACPRCHTPVERADESLLCPACGGPAARIRHGVHDFLHDRATLDGALGSKFDLRADELVAQQLDELRASGADYDSVLALREELEGALPHQCEACGMGRQRYYRWYWRLQGEVGQRAGDGIVEKVNLHLRSKGRPALSGRWALEAGSGPGAHVPGFRRTFDHVLVVDCSLAQLVLTRTRVEELGIDNVFLARADVEALPVADRTVNFVHENGVIEHVEDPDAMIAEALRVLGAGTYVCLSPNRFPITREPHFRIPLFGLWPRAVRRRIIARTTGQESETGTDLLSLRRLRRRFRGVGEAPEVFFLPPRLAHTVRRSSSRRALSWLLQRRGLGRLVSWLVNGPLLAIAPYHFAVVVREADPV
jgi:SAM-dependent methyltransferase